MFTIHLKKIFLAVLILAVTSVNNFAQTSKVGTIAIVEGDALVKVLGRMREEVRSYLGKDRDSNMLFYCVQRKTPTKMTEYLVAYDTKMRVVKRTEIKNEFKKSDEPYFFKLKNKIYFMPLFTDNLKVNCYEFDIKTATVLTTPVIQTNLSFNNNEYLNNKKIIFSPDSSFFVIQGTNLGVTYFKLFDAKKMKEINSTSVMTNDKNISIEFNGPLSINDAVLDNLGNIYVLKMAGILKKERKDRIITKSFAQVCDYTCVKIDKTGKVTEQTLSLENKHLHSALLAISEDILVVGGLYSQNNAESIGAAGFALLLLDMDMKVIKTTLKAVGPDILKKGKIDGNIIDANTVQRICITKNHIFIVNKPPLFKSDYTTKEIALFTDTGDAVWVKEIGRIGNDYSLYPLSIRPFAVLDNCIAFIHFDSKKSRETSLFKLSDLSNAAAVITTIDTKGEVSEQAKGISSAFDSTTDGVTLIALDGTKVALFTLTANLATIK
jgi:hypothetical protein